MPRLFTAIEIPDQLRSRLAMLRAGLRGARWVDPDNFHITVRFVGNVDQGTAREFDHALTQIRHEPFDLTVEGLGSFGERKPRAVWAGVVLNEPLLALQRAHERAARTAGLPPETRNFKPHVTLARLNGGQPGDVARYLGLQGGLFSQTFAVTRFVLLSSRASTGGGPYVVEQAYPLLPRGAD